MKKTRLWFVFAGFMFLANPSVHLVCQQVEGGLAFDSIYSKGLDLINSDLTLSRQCLLRLELYSQPSAPLQQARVSYLRLKIFQADPGQVSAFEKRIFAAPDSLGHKEALFFTATRYLERSMPDKAIPLLMAAIEINGGPDWTTWCTIHLCEA